MKLFLLSLLFVSHVSGAVIWTKTDTKSWLATGDWAINDEIGEPIPADVIADFDGDTISLYEAALGNPEDGPLHEVDAFYFTDKSGLPSAPSGMDWWRVETSEPLFFEDDAKLVAKLDSEGIEEGQIWQGGGDINFVAFQSIPEPRTSALLIAGLLVLFFRRRR